MGWDRWESQLLSSGEEPASLKRIRLLVFLFFCFFERGSGFGSENYTVLGLVKVGFFVKRYSFNKNITLAL